MTTMFTTKRKPLDRFGRDKRGNVAMIGAMSAFVMVGLTGLSIDFSRTMSARTALQNATDGAALAVGAKKNLTLEQQQSLVNAYINANLHLDPSFGSVSDVTLTPGDGKLTVAAKINVPTTLGLLLGRSLPATASSNVVWGQTKLWVSLALDNTGSMMETDSHGQTKLSALITATDQLLAMLQGVAAHPGDVEVALVPFSKTVNVGAASNVNATWIDWTDWESAPANATTVVSSTWNKYGPQGSKTGCPWSTSNNGFSCQTTPVNGSATTTTIPTSGAYAGYICPTVDNGSKNAGRAARYYNGCFNSVKQVPTCTSNCLYNHTWIPNAHNTWGGCIMDRAQPYDTNATAPTDAATRFPAENTQSCVSSVMLGTLGHAWGDLKAKTDAMTANGNTNQTIGFQWAWMAQTGGDPLNAPALPDFTTRYIILLSDGLNTQNRWSSSQSAIDARMTAACANAKAAGVVIYTVFVNTGGSGSSSVLQSCATDSSKFYNLTTSGAIVSAFNAIGQEITHLRVAPDTTSAGHGHDGD